MSRLRTVFMGTPEIAVPALRALARASELTCVITQPDRPAGRGHQLQEPPAKAAARALGIPVWQPETMRGAEAHAALGCDLVVVLAYGELLRQAVLDRPLHGCVNLHASLLPRWRGASPLQAALRAGDARTGVTVMRMVRALDAGPVYLQRELGIAAAMTLPALHDAIAELAAQALGEFLAAWPPPAPTPQDEAGVTLCRKLLPADGRLDWRLPGAELERWVRAYTPAPGCWSETTDEKPLRLRILALAPCPGASEAAPGTVARAGDDLLVACGDGAVRLTRLQVAGGTPQGAREFLNGHAAPRALA
jgi:methionyl-tRNA formyltransferase